MIDTVRKYRNAETDQVATVTRFSNLSFGASWYETNHQGDTYRVHFEGSPNEIGHRLISEGFTQRVEA